VAVSQKQCDSSTPLEILNLIDNIPVFSKFLATHCNAIINSAQKRTFKRGDVLLERGDRCDQQLQKGVSVIAMGVVRVEWQSPADGRRHFIRYLGVGEEFGSTPMYTGRPVTVYLVAHTPEVELYQWRRYDFLHAAHKTSIASEVAFADQLACDHSRTVMMCNSALRCLPPTLLEQFQTRLVRRETASGEVLWEKGRPAAEVVLVDSGAYRYAGTTAAVQPFARGCLLADIDSLTRSAHGHGAHNHNHGHGHFGSGGNSTTLVCEEGGAVFCVSQRDIISFFTIYTKFQLIFDNAPFVE
jgi:CRP-like cAMP-binding protein